MSFIKYTIFFYFNLQVFFVLLSLAVKYHEHCFTWVGLSPFPASACMTQQAQPLLITNSN